MTPSEPIIKHFRLTPSQIAALKRLGLTTIGELLRHFPARYQEAGASVRVEGLVPGSKVTLLGALTDLKAKKLWKSRRNVTEGWFEDASGKVKVMWFNQPYIASYVPQGSTVKITGTVGGKVERPYIANPEVEHLPPGTIADGLFCSADHRQVTTGNSILPECPEGPGSPSR